jgi:2,5-diketo-D-gluconate reductase B
LLREAQAVSPVPIAVNQVELHPFLRQDDLLNFCQKNGIEVVAHTPFAGGLVFESRVLQNAAERYDATVAQIVLAWLINKKNVSAIPKATGDHIEENYDSIQVQLTQADIDEIESIEGEHRVVDYAFAPWNQ